MILYCASGNRSAFAARTLLEDLGYDNVESMRGGITLWKDRGYEVEVPKALTKEQRERYSRHLLIPEVGVEGQQKLLDAKVLLLGAGGLGSPAALYLAAAGVGTLGIVDNDEVDLSNLQRQVIHDTDRIGVPKVDSAEQTIRRSTPTSRWSSTPCASTPPTSWRSCPGYDVVVDGLDNFPTRYLLNDASVRLQIPVVCAAILGFEGQLSVFKPYDGPCYRCLFPEPPPAELAPSCGANGVLGVLPGTMGLLQATEVVKLIIGEGDPLIGRLLLYDALAASFQTVARAPRPRLPDLLARARRRSPTTSSVSSRTTRRSARRPGSLRAAPWRPSASHPCCALPWAARRKSTPRVTRSARSCARWSRAIRTPKASSSAPTAA